LALRKTEPSSPAAPPNRTAKSESRKIKEQHKQSAQNRICCASTKVQQAGTVGRKKKIGANRKSARPNSYNSAEGNPAGRSRTEGISYAPQENQVQQSERERERGGEPEFAPSMRESGRVVVLVPHGGLDWSGGWSWSRSGRATTTTPNCLGAAPSVVAGGRPSPQPQEKTSVALRKQTEGDGKKKKRWSFFFSFLFI